MLTAAMPRCCHLTRREVLQWGAIVAASPLLSALGDVERAYGLTRAVAGNPAVPMHLELVTLTETSAIVTWFTGDPTRVDEAGRAAPMPADTEVLLGTSPANLRQVVYDATPTPYHYAEITGLEPGQTYFYVARSGGLPATAAISTFGNPAGTSTVNSSPSGPFVFAAPDPPPGQFLFAVALCNDLHLGETVAGLAATLGNVQVPPGITQVPGEPPYAEVMAAALGTESRARGANILLANGDISSEGGQVDIADAKAYLDAFGPYLDSYLVTRGNHDRPHSGDAAAACSPSARNPSQHDCFGDAFFPSATTWFAKEAYGLRIVGLDTYDKLGNGGDNGVLSDEQFAFVRDELQRDPDQPTVVVGHHPVTLESSITTVRPLIFDLDPQQAVQLEALYANTPGVFLQHSGHPHRNKLTRSPQATNVAFQEVGAVKEYPGGFTLLRVHSGGYATNFYKFKDPLAQEWSERSRPEYGGLAPFYVFGDLIDRNSVTARDFSDLHAAAASSSPAINDVPESTAGGRILPATGSDDRAALIVAGAATAAALSAEAYLKRVRG